MSVHAKLSTSLLYLKIFSGVCRAYDIERALPNDTNSDLFDRNFKTKARHFQIGTMSSRTWSAAKNVGLELIGHVPGSLLGYAIEVPRRRQCMQDYTLIHALYTLIYCSTSLTTLISTGICLLFFRPSFEKVQKGNGVVSWNKENTGSEEKLDYISPNCGKDTDSSTTQSIRSRPVSYTHLTLPTIYSV